VSVLDASALLAYLRDEPGADAVAEAIADGATISTVNLAEVLSRAADHGGDPGLLAGDLTRRGLLGGALVVEDFTAADAIEVARLRPLTRQAGLSLADRACLALTRRLSTLALTADSAWAELTVDIQTQQIRPQA
jgi:PIN domain nuclease of toxin-antitoxin system